MLERLARGESDLDRRARAALELWFEELPIDEQAAMHSRLLADDGGFRSAFFELFLHALFTRLGYSPQIHPQVSTEHERAPDFLLRRGNSPRFYLEATVVDEESTEVARQRKLAIMFQALREITSDAFDLGLESAEFREESFDRKRVIRSVQNWVDALDPVQVDIEGMSKSKQGKVANFADGPLSLRVWAIPRAINARGIRTRVRVIRVGTEVRRVACAAAVRRSLGRKSRRYGDMHLPYVVAVNALGFGCDAEEIQGAAFGTLSTLIPESNDPSTPTVTTRADDGAMSDADRSGSLRVSGVLAEVGLTPWSMFDVRTTPVLLLNPEARFSLSDHELPFLRIEDGRGDGSVAGKSFIPAQRILRLDKVIKLRE
jgi:hypothetical protein